MDSKVRYMLAIRQRTTKAHKRYQTVRHGLQEVAVSKVTQARDNVRVAVEALVHPRGNLPVLAECL